MKEKTAKIDNFIGVYDNYISDEECDKAIKLYESENKFNNTINRISSENESITSDIEIFLSCEFNCLTGFPSFPIHSFLDKSYLTMLLSSNSNIINCFSLYDFKISSLKLIFYL